MARSTTPAVSPIALEQAIAAASNGTTQSGCQTPTAVKQKSSAEKIGITWGFFNGDIHDWPKFSKKFNEEVINDASLDNKQKLALLSRSCFETARDIVSCAGDDFAAVWAHLNEIYGESYIIMYHTMQKVMVLKKIPSPSYDGIRYLAANGEKFMAALQTINMADSFGPFLVVLLSAKLTMIRLEHGIAIALIWRKNGQ